MRDHHEARLSELLWDGHTVSAGRMLDLVPRGPRALAEARIALQKDENGVDKLIKAVPRKQASDAGLAYDRFAWRDRKRRADDAIALMQERSTSAAALGEPAKWLSRRRDHAPPAYARQEIPRRLSAGRQPPRHARRRLWLCRL